MKWWKGGSEMENQTKTTWRKEKRSNRRTTITECAVGRGVATAKDSRGPKSRQSSQSGRDIQIRKTQTE